MSGHQRAGLAGDVGDVITQLSEVSGSPSLPCGPESDHQALSTSRVGDTSASPEPKATHPQSMYTMSGVRGHKYWKFLACLDFDTHKDHLAIRTKSLSASPPHKCQLQIFNVQGMWRRGAKIFIFFQLAPPSLCNKWNFLVCCFVSFGDWPKQLLRAGQVLRTGLHSGTPFQKFIC